MRAASLLSYLLVAPSAKAEPEPYCIAYARDLANRKVLPPVSSDPALVTPAGDLMTAAVSVPQSSDDGARMELLWRRAYKRALEGCLDQYSSDEPKRLPAAPKAVAPAKPVARTVEKQTDPVDDDAPKRGSEEWKRKCLAQHPSFDAQTGTYRTWSGAQRECRL